MVILVELVDFRVANNVIMRVGIITTVVMVGKIVQTSVVLGASMIIDFVFWFSCLIFVIVGFLMLVWKSCQLLSKEDNEKESNSNEIP